MSDDTPAQPAATRVPGTTVPWRGWVRCGVCGHERRLAEREPMPAEPIDCPECVAAWKRPTCRPCEGP